MNFCGFLGRYHSWIIERISMGGYQFTERYKIRTYYV